jgi:hypothetical protein
MERITLSKNTGFTLIPEGFHVFKVVDVDMSKYDGFGKIEVKLETASGQKHSERFSLLNNKGEVNEGALNAFSYFVRTVLNDYKAEDIDPAELIGHFIRAEIKHVVSDRINEKTGKPYVNANLGDKEPALGFEGDVDDVESDDLEEL